MGLGYERDNKTTWPVRALDIKDWGKASGIGMWTGKQGK